MSNGDLGPWFSWFPDAFNRKAGHLSREDECSYRRLIDATMMLGGPLPDDDVQLAYIAKCNLREWRKTRPALAPFFDIHDGHWFQPRAMEEIVRARGLINKRRLAARARWDKPNGLNPDDAHG